MSERNFKELYNKLNKSQREAVDTIEGPVIVIAGPGTGKTQILSLRIANILKKTDVPADAILALTFTESGVYSMRKRLVEIIGSRAYKINIYTFHGFANELIGKYPEYFEKIIGFSNIDDVERIKLFEEIIDSLSLKFLRPYGDPYYYLKPLLSVIPNLKKDDISPENLSEIIKKQEEDFIKIDDLYHERGAHKGKMKGKYSDLLKKIEKNKELLKIYNAYQRKLHERKQYDYEDMIMEVLKVLEKDKDLLLKLQEEYQYILADEHQDTNRSQNKLLELLSDFHENPNLFVVGDEKQAIFRFQGASLENFLYFKNKYKEAKVISLEDNYRSPQEILDASASLIGNSSDALLIERPRLISRKDMLLTKKRSLNFEKKQKITIHSFRTNEDENLFIAQDIKEKIKKGVGASSIVVFYRNNKEAFPLSVSLEKVGVPFVIESDQDILADENIVKLVAILRTINEPGNNKLIAEILFFDIFDIPITDVIKVIKEANKERKEVLDVLMSDKSLKKIHLNDPEKVKVFYKKIISWASFAKNKNLVETLDTINRESGMLKKILKEGITSLHKLETFLGFAKTISTSRRFPKISDFIEYIDLLDKHSIKIRKRDSEYSTDAVKLMTAHRSKGLEFDHVYISGLNDKNWGNRREIRHFHLPIKGFLAEGFDPNDDERRLFYVALTRSKENIILTYSNEDEKANIILPSQFIEEIDNKFKSHARHEGRTLSPKSKYDFNSRHKRTLDIKNKKFLNTLFLDSGLSISAINNYLNCPWQYFFENLVRLPKAQNKFQSYGSAVHNALNDIFNLKKKGKKISAKTLLESFQKHLSKQVLSESEYDELLEKGKNSLTGFFQYFKERIKADSLSEYQVVGIYLDIPSVAKGDTKKRIMARGRLDLVENMEGDIINVVDFKTSKPKSRNEILGKTQKGDKSIWRQLVFYKLLMEEISDKNYILNTGEIIFTEPNEKGKYLKEVFEISDEDKKEMKTLVQDIAREIINLSFWGKSCNKIGCKYCELSKNL